MRLLAFFILVSCSSLRLREDARFKVFQNGNHIKSVVVNSNNDILKKSYYVEDSIDVVLNYIYDGDGFSHIKSSEPSMDEFYTRKHKNYLTSLGNLKQKNIEVNNSFILSENLIEMDLLLSLKDVSIEKRKDTTSFVVSDIDSRVNFGTNNISKFIPQSILLYDYQLYVKNGVVVKEKLEFEDGILSRLYLYRDSQILEVSTICRYTDGEILSQNIEVK